MKTQRLVTRKILEQMNACATEVYEAVKEFPEMNGPGVPITKENLEAARKAGLDLYWFFDEYARLERDLSHSVWEDIEWNIYERVGTSLNEEYHEAIIEAFLKFLEEADEKVEAEV